METIIVRDTLTRPDKKRIWELDFLRGISILLMVIDHLFYNLAYMFYGDWKYSGNQGAINAINTARFYETGVAVPDQYMWLADCAIFVMFLIFCVVAFFSYGKLRKDGNRILKVLGLSIVIIGIMLIVNKVYGYDASHTKGCGLRDWVHTFVLWIFFALCGISCFFSHNNILRTAEIAICAGLITLFTYIGETYADMGQITVRYGVLHMLATSVAIFTLVQVVVNLFIRNKKVAKYVIAGICFAIGVTSYVLCHYFNTLPYSNVEGMAFLHRNFSKGFSSSDYFALLQYLPMVMFGCAIAPFLYPDKKTMLPHLDHAWHKPVCFCGRHTLIIVLAHQPVITGLLALISYFVVTPGSFGL